MSAVLAELAELARLMGTEPPRWQELGLCAQVDPDAFYPGKGESAREAKKICLRCEVQAECLEYAMERDERFGVWGGLSERERRTLRRQRGAAAITRREGAL